MGQLFEGKWASDAIVSAAQNDGSWTRTPSSVRGWIKDDMSDFSPAPARYHLYAAWNCPWAHRVLLTRAILGLQDVIPVSYVAPARTSNGWVFDPNAGYVDTHSGYKTLHQIYSAGHPNYTGRVTVPLLMDTVSGQLVSNESADLVRMLPPAFISYADNPIDLYPENQRAKIDQWNEKIHMGLNNGVYRAGFAESQIAYDEAVEQVFQTLDDIEHALSQSPYLAGGNITEADIRLFPTLARFDVAYHTAFKCSRRRIIDYPYIWRYARKIYALPNIADSVKFDIYRRGYFSRSDKRNPHGIVPTAPDIDWSITETKGSPK